MRATIVLADQGVEDRFPRSCIAHHRGQHRQHHTVTGIVEIQQNLIAAHPHGSGDVVRLGLPYKGMKQEPIHHL